MPPKSVKRPTLISSPNSNKSPASSTSLKLKSPASSTSLKLKSNSPKNQSKQFTPSPKGNKSVNGSKSTINPNSTKLSGNVPSMGKSNPNLKTVGSPAGRGSNYEASSPPMKRGMSKTSTDRSGVSSNRSGRVSPNNSNSPSNSPQQSLKSRNNSMKLPLPVSRNVKKLAKQQQQQKEQRVKPKSNKPTVFHKIYNKYIKPPQIKLTSPSAQSATSVLGLTMKHLRRLKNQFDLIDVDGSGSIDSDEFFEMLDERRSPFTDALFALIDTDGSGTIEFEEYIMVCVTYCMYTKSDVLRFCFDCFDEDGSGSLDEKEYIDLCRTVNNATPMFPGNFKAAVEQFDSNEDGVIDFNEFIELDRRFPLILFPAFRLQDRMQHKTLGENGWVKIHEGLQRQRRLREYMDAHGGARPPDTRWRKVYKVIFGACFSFEEVKLRDSVGEAQENSKQEVMKMKNSEAGWD